MKIQYKVVGPKGETLHVFNRRSDAELCCWNYNNAFNTNKFKIRWRIVK